MINFKIIINKIIIENNKINLYNSVINENLKNIKELFELNNLNVSTHKQADGSITLHHNFLRLYSSIYPIVEDNIFG